MKRSLIIVGLALMLLVSGNGLLYSQRGMGVMPDSTRMGMKKGMPGMQMHGMRQNAVPMHIRGMRHGMCQMPMNNAGMRHMGPGNMMLESIPNVTEKQKKDIADLQMKQQDEMKKLRDEMTAKMQTMRDTHRKNMMNILTDEQKKFLESKAPKADTPPVTTK